ncbi:MAG TPA: di-heme enzyme [Labilithrix sp.]|nr:di-heme enzyme [Labilithrix sp.]
MAAIRRWLLGAALCGGAVIGACRSPVDDGGAAAPTGDASTAPDSASSDGEADGGFAWDLPPGFPRPPVPADNPMTAEKVELGRRLFYDKTLSIDGTYACATCHVQSKAFTDGRARGLGVTGEMHARGAPGLANVGYMATLTWPNPILVLLEKQALLPLFGTSPVELGLAGKEEELFARLRGDARYPALFARAFPSSGGAISLATITQALASFERTILSGRSPYDRLVIDHDGSTMSDSAKRGSELFFSEKADCYHCHGGFNFTDSVVRADSSFVETAFHNTGLYDVDGKGGYPAGSYGLFEFTGKAEDMGKFRAPSLRNVALTAPYMHDGSVATLEDVIEVYVRGGRAIADGPNAGDGATNPFKDGLVRPLPLTASDKQDLAAFLRSLTDESLLVDPRFGPPAD